MIRVLILAPEEEARAALAAVVRDRPGIELAGTVADPAAVPEALAVTAADVVLMPAALLADLTAERAPAPVAREDAARALTPREREVLAALADGASNKAIARRLGISFHTVKFHVAQILEKLGAETRTEAVAEGARRGLVML
jgi:DNA-binding NarL/FixJ family response regulator